MTIVGFSGISNSDFYKSTYGLDFVGHDSSISIIKDGQILFCAEEERFNREKHTGKFPSMSLGQGLEYCEISYQDITNFSYPWKLTPRKFLKITLHHLPNTPIKHIPELGLMGIRITRDLMSPKRIFNQFKASFPNSVTNRLDSFSHHECHASVSYFTSEFDKSASLTIEILLKPLNVYMPQILLGYYMV